jgi:hypothetical protein
MKKIIDQKKKLSNKKWKNSLLVKKKSFLGKLKFVPSISPTFSSNCADEICPIHESCGQICLLLAKH